MKGHEPYDENKLVHQEPVIPISQWQEFNDYDGWEEIEQQCEERAAQWRKEAQEGMKSVVPASGELRAKMRRLIQRAPVPLSTAEEQVRNALK